MAAEFPADLREDIKAEVARILPLLKEAGWAFNPIQWESTSGRERRVCAIATSETGKQFHLTCPAEGLAKWLTVLPADTR